MSGIVVVGAQWGDEGKGKIVDVFADQADLVVRFQGGANAGHTLVVNGVKTVLHLIPSGILHPEKTCLIAPGVVLDLEGLTQEIRTLKQQGLSISPKQLLISDNTAVILPVHKKLDKAREVSLDSSKIGTTGKGIGPAYEDRAARRAILFRDIFNEDVLKRKLELLLPEKNALFQLYKLPEEKLSDCMDFIRSLRGELEAYRCNDTSLYVQKTLKASKRVLFEGAQGTLLDVLHGTYPYVTSSSTIAAAACGSTGIGPTSISKVIGIFKAYATRVGSGPFPSELHDEVGKKIQKDGHEFGATTGRPRRCGWLDLVALKYAIRLNGITNLAMMKLDVLSNHEKIGVCVAYKLGNEILTEFPTSVDDLEKVECVVEYLPGWKEDITRITHLSNLPRAATSYLDFIQKHVSVPIDVISVGPGREQTLWVKPLMQG